MAQLHIGPVTLSMGDGGSICETLEAMLESSVPSQIVTFNALMFTRALDDAAYAAAISGAALAVCDSVGIAWAVKLLNGRAVQRLPGIDLLYQLCQTAARTRQRVYLLGAKPGVADRAAAELQRRYPGLIVAGTGHGYFDRADARQVVQAIRDAKTDVLFVAMDMPFQEQWIAANLKGLGVRIAMGVGGSFDVIAGDIRRAPRWMQRWGVEWLYRLMRQPSRAFRMAGLAVFVLKVYKIKLFGYRRSL